MKTYAASYTSSVINNGPSGMEWVVLLSYDDEVSALRFAFKDTQIITTQYYGALLEVSFGESGFDPYTGANNNGSCKIVIADDTSNTITNLITGKGFVNRRARVYRHCEGMSTPVSNDPEFDGTTVEYYYDVENRTWIFECEILTQHRTIPQSVVTKAAYPKAPEYSIGSVLPLLYGRFTMSDTGTRGDAVHGLFHLAPTICTDATEGIYVLSGHAVSGINDEMVSMYLSGLDTYGTGIHIWNGSASVYPTVTLTGTASVTLPITNARVFRADNIWLFPKLKGTYNTFASSSADAVDGDYNTDATIGASTRYAVRFPAGGLGDNAEFPATVASSDLQLLAWFKAHSGSGINGGIYNPIIAVNYSPSGLSGTGLMTWNIASPTSGTRSLNDGTTFSSAAQWSFDEVSLYEYYLSVPAASSVDISTLCIVANLCIVSGRIQKVIEVGQYRKRGVRVFGVNLTGDRNYTVEHVSYRYKADPIARERGLANIFCTVDGRKFGAWIGSRNGLSTSTVIAKSNYIIESILRDEMNVDDAFIDETSFDNDYSDAYTFAFSLTQRESSQHVLQDLAKQSACYAFRKASGLWTIKRLPASPSSADIALDYSLGDCAIKSIVKSPQSWIQNEVRVLYNYDYARGEYTRDITAEDATSKGSTAPAVKATAIAEIGADFIRHDSDSGVTNYASSLRDYELSQWAYQHNIIEFDIMNPAYFYAEEGDVVNFDNVTQNLGGIGSGSSGDYWGSFTSPATAYWIIYSIVPQLDRVSCKAIQLHTL